MDGTCAQKIQQACLNNLDDLSLNGVSIYFSSLILQRELSDILHISVYHPIP